MSFEVMRGKGFPDFLVRVVVPAVFVCVLISGDAGAQRPRVVPPNAESSPLNPPVPVPVPAPVPPPRAVPAREQEPAKDGPAFIAVIKAQNEAILKRLGNRLVNGRLKKEAMPSGAAGMNLFSATNHEEKTYIRNPDLWAQDLVRHLTGVVIYNDFTQESYGGVLITPRHLLFCAHAHPHAHQTWGPNPNRPGAVHRFLTSDGRVVESVQLHQAKSYGVHLLPGLESLDLCVALLDRDMEAEGLKVVPIFPPVSRGAVAAAAEWARTEKQPVAFIGISQGTTRPTQKEPPEPAGDYPRKHERMIYIKDLNDPGPAGGSRGPFAPWNYHVWDGDSGTPAFLLLNGVPHLWMILTMAPGNGPRPGSHIGHIEGLIAAADANAILLERLERPTGLKPRIGNLKP